MFSFVELYQVYRVKTAHDEQAFARIYDAYVEAIYRFVYVKISSKEQAQDLTSEAFLRLWQMFKRGENIRHVRGLLYRIARHLVVDAYRRKGTSSERIPVTFSEHETTSLVEAASDQGRGKNVMEGQADLALVLDHVRQLKEDYQDVLTLRLFDGLSFADIGSILEKDTGTVRVLYHRALKALHRRTSLNLVPSVQEVPQG